MAAAWPAPVERVSSFLRDAGADARIEEFSADTPTAAEAAAVVGCGLDQIVKTLVFVGDGRPVVALVPGDRRADPAKLARAAGEERVRVAKADEVREATGFEPGAVAPFPLPGVETVLMERALLGHKLVWAGAGSEKYLVGLSPTDLAQLARARPLDIVTDYDSPGEKEN